MFGFGKGRFGGGRGGGCHKRFRNRHSENGLLPLDMTEENHRYVVVSNANKKTLEMGIYPGIILEVQKNSFDDTNLIIKINDSRLIVPCNIAKAITVK